MDVTPGSMGEDVRFMRLALEEAQAAADDGEVPVGAVAVLEGRVVARQRNRKERLRDPTAHAEILLLRDAASRLERWRLPDVTVYCTMEPCAMCAGAMIQARIPRLVFAVPDLRAGAAGSVFDVVREARLNHRIDVTEGVLAEEARAQLNRFFRGLRARGTEGGSGTLFAPEQASELAGAPDGEGCPSG